MSSARDRLKAKLAAKNGEAAPAPEVPVEEKPKVVPKKAVPGNSKAALLAKLQKQKEIEAEKRAWEAEQARLEAEERERAIEEERRAKEEAEAQAEARRIERDILRKEGKLLTAKQKAQQEQAARMREMLAAQGLFPTDAVIANAEEKQKKQANNTNKAPVKTKIQLDAERIRMEQERKEADRVRIRDEALMKVREENSELMSQYDELTSTVQAQQQELDELLVQLSQLKLEKEEADKKAEDVDELDDWDADSDGEEDDSKIVRNEKIDQLTTQTTDIESTLNGKKEALSTVTVEVESLRKVHVDSITKMEEQKRKEAEVAAREAEQRARDASENAHASGTMRSPIVVILGHVDSGKTSLLDRIRSSSVTAGEAGGITQQIGATFVPAETIKGMCVKLPEEQQAVSKLKLPGLLCIDTPGHESFSMLRARGSDICDLAILVVDIQKSLQQQTIESIQLLRERNTPFVVAITKVDALYTWNKSAENSFNPIQKSLETMTDDAGREYEKLMLQAVASFANEHINAVPFYENKDPSKYVSLVPLSSKTGEGIPDLLNLICELTQTRMNKRLEKSADSGFQCTVLEVKNLEGQGTTLDVILVNGTIKVDDTIVCAGIEGPIVTKVKALLTPPPLRDQRVSTEFQSNKVVQAAMGFKIAGPNLDKVLSGSSLYVVKNPRDTKELDDLMDLVQEDVHDVVSRLDTDNNGVFVHASSLGSLEALLTFLRDNSIPIAGFDIGTVSKMSITKTSIQLDKRKPEYAVLLAFDVNVDPDAQAMADKMGVKIISKNVIYHLNDECLKHFKTVRDQQKASAKPVFPCVAKFLAMFRSSDPVILGLKIVAGTLRIGTPLYIPAKGNLIIGRVMTIKKDDKPIEIAKKGDEVSVGIDQNHLEHPPVFGRHFDGTHDFISHMNRSNVDTLREFYADDLTETDNKLLDKFIELFKI